MQHLLDRLLMPYRLSLYQVHQPPTVPGDRCSLVPATPPDQQQPWDCSSPCSQLSPRGRRFKQQSETGPGRGSIVYYLPPSKPISSLMLCGAVRRTEYVHHLEVGEW
jgi:hypothetical protein